MRRQFDQQLVKIKEEVATRDADAQSERNAHRDAVARQAEELRQALEDATRSRDACAAAESVAKTMGEASCKAAEKASSAEASLESTVQDLQVAREETQKLQKSLAEERLALERSQEDVDTRREAQHVAERSIHQSSERLIELEGLLEEAQCRMSQVDIDLQDSLQKFAELTQTAEAYKGQATAEAAKADNLKAAAVTQVANLHEAFKKITDFEDMLKAVRVQLEGEKHGVQVLRSRELGMIYFRAHLRMYLAYWSWSHVKAVTW